MKKNKKYLFLIFPILIVLGINAPNTRILELAKNIEIYASILKELDKLYVEEIDPKKLVETSINQMLETMDPYTNYYPEDEVDNFLTLTTGKYEGIGIVLDRIEDEFFIVGVEKEGPADLAGLKFGDQITQVGDQDIFGKMHSEVNKLIAGKAGTNVRLKIKSLNGIGSHIVEIKRSTIHLKNINNYQIIGDQIGYIDLNEFNHESAQEFKSAFLELKNQGMKKLIIDLSSNPGGLLTQAVEISNLFIPKNNFIVETKGKRKEWNSRYYTNNEALDETIPLAIIINANSASASEILAGAIQDYDRGLIIGQKSFGKGLVQITRDLPYRTKIKLTTARYYIPSGRCIQKVDYFEHENNLDTTKFISKNGRILENSGGISPDIVVKGKEYKSFYQFIMENKLALKFSFLKYPDYQDEIIGENWEISDTIYQEFLHWIKTKNYHYSSPEKELLDSLYANIHPNEKNHSWGNRLKDLIQNPIIGFDHKAEESKEEIKLALTYFFLSEKFGKLKADQFMVKNSDEINQAIKILNNPSKMNGILTK